MLTNLSFTARKTHFKTFNDCKIYPAPTHEIHLNICHDFEIKSILLRKLFNVGLNEVRDNYGVVVDSTHSFNFLNGLDD